VEELIKQMYEDYCEQLLSCSLEDKERIYYIRGGQIALEYIALKKGFKLKRKNIEEFLEEKLKLDNV
jgi:hypothetical protein